MLKIWGVGVVTAKALYSNGYADIESVRRDLKSSKLNLERNQKIGVEFYEGTRSLLFKGYLNDLCHSLTVIRNPRRLSRKDESRGSEKDRKYC